MNAININYDELLVGQTDTLDPGNFFGSPSDGQREREAVSCLRYIFADILQWDADEATKKFDEYMSRLLKLDSLIRYIDFPVEMPYGEPKYILSLVFPGKIRIDKRKMVEKIYKNVLDAENNDEKHLKQFPRDYFTGGDGFLRFCVCVSYLIENIKPIGSVRELYDFFSSPEGKKFLYTYRLKIPADQFSIDMVEVIRSITAGQPESELWYSFYRFKELYGTFERKANLSSGKEVHD